MERTDHAQRLLAIIDTQNRIAAAKLDLDAVMELVVERAQSLTGADAAVLEIANGDEVMFAASAGTITAPGGAQSMISAPLLQAGQPVGELKAYSATWQAFDIADTETLGLLSAVIAAQLDAKAREGQADTTRRDALTGLGNRRAYEERLEAECSRARRHGDPVTLSVLDLDGFEQVNAVHGQPAGDELLRQVADILGRLRTEDMAFQIGDDEFALILPATTAAQARIALERLTAHIKARSFGAVTASFGLADEPLDPAGLHAAADAELLAAKAERRRAVARA